MTFIHDLIPIEFPEYARPQHAEIHMHRVRTAAALSDAIIVNSHATASSLSPYLAEAGRSPPVLVAPLGVQPLPGAAARPGGAPVLRVSRHHRAAQEPSAPAQHLAQVGPELR